jgi:hypothetical protein
MSIPISNEDARFIEKANIDIKLGLAILQSACLCKIASQQASAGLKRTQLLHAQ